MTRSHDDFEAACRHIPGGVNSPVRAFRGVGGEPVFFASGEGPCLVDVDGKRYIDYRLGFGPIILGHGYPRVVEKVQQAVSNGTVFAWTTPAEIEVADLAPLALELALWGAGNGEGLAFLTPPNPGVLDEARNLLASLGALDAQGRITPHGKRLARLPLPGQRVAVEAGGHRRGDAGRVDQDRGGRAAEDRAADGVQDIERRAAATTRPSTGIGAIASMTSTTGTTNR